MTDPNLPPLPVWLERYLLNNVSAHRTDDYRRDIRAYARAAIAPVVTRSELREAQLADAVKLTMARAEKAEAELAALREAVRGLGAKWRQIAGDPCFPDESYRDAIEAENATLIRCADELEAALRAEIHAATEECNRCKGRGFIQVSKQIVCLAGQESQTLHCKEPCPDCSGREEPGNG